MKILIVSSGLKMGGVERASSNMANFFSECGSPVVFLALFPLDRFFTLDNRVEFVEPFPFNRTRTHIFKTIAGLRKEIKKHKPSVILAYTKFYSALTCLACIGLRQSVVITERSSALYKWPFHITVFARISFWLSPPIGVISQTRSASRHHSKYYGRKVKNVVINNSVRQIKLYPEIPRENFILAIGRPNDHGKGFDRLIKAFAMLNNKTWTLKFAGVGAEDDELHALSENLDVKNRIIFLGKVKDIDFLLAHAGIFVIPSRKEGFPNALCEAMAAGVPCISFDFDAGPSEIINHGLNGLLIEDGNIPQLAAAMDSLIEDNALRERLSMNALAVRETLNPSRIGQQYLSFLSSTLN